MHSRAKWKRVALPLDTVWQNLSPICAERDQLIGFISRLLMLLYSKETAKLAQQRLMPSRSCLVSPHCHPAWCALLIHKRVLTAPGYLRGVELVSSGDQQVPLISVIVHAVCTCRDDQHDAVQLQVIKALLTAVTSNYARVHGSTLLAAVRSVIHIYLVTKNGVNRTTAKAALTQMLNVVHKRMEDAARDEELTKQAPEWAETPEGFTSPYHVDAVTLFRALCRMCLRVEGASAASAGGGDAAAEGESLTTDLPVQQTSGLAAFLSGTKAPQEGKDSAVALSSRLLALELLFGILGHAGELFRLDAQFLAVIRSSLCVALLRNAVHSAGSVASISLRIFLTLLKSFGTQLLAEIEVFITSVLLRILDSHNVEHEQKMLVLSVFHSIGSDGITSLELFLNFDCVAGRSRVFENMLRTLSSIAQGRASDAFTSTQTSQADGAAAKGMALAALNKIMEAVSLQADAAAKASGLLGQLQPLGGDSDDEGGEAGGATAAAEEDLDADGDGPIGRSASVVGDALAGEYDKLKQRRQLLERAALKFKLKPKRGVAWMQEVGIIHGPSADAVAAALHEHKGILDKTAIGDYLGEEKQFTLDVLEAYAKQMDFDGIKFDAAIRKYLSGFRIPGEAQKIDRIMERFAERFVAQNAGIFPSADTAFILAYSVIMLQTDLHNPSIREDRRMTKAAFLNNNRGIADGQDLPADFLSDIYDAIKKTPISLREDEDARARLASKAANPKLRREAFSAEKEAILKDGTLAIRRNTTGGSAAGPEAMYRSAEALSLESVRAVFDVLWAPLLAVFSINLENSHDPATVNGCLEGFSQAVHVAGLTGLTLERDALTMSLAKFTLLDQPGREMRPKNVAAVKTIMQLAVTDGRFLGDAWLPVLTCVSQVGRLHNLAAGGMSDSAFFPERQGGASARWRKGGGAGGAGGGFSSSGSESERARALTEAIAAERSNAQYIVSAIPEDWITRVFTASANLDSSSVMEFVQHLAAVSLQELQLPAMPATADTPSALPRALPRKPSDGSSVSSASTLPSTAGGVALSLSGPPGTVATPRVFSLQKLVEVADYNMEGRPRVIWATMWDALSRYFTAVGCHSNLHVSMYAIDSLKQLTMKFLIKGDLKHFQFQPKFLAPFVAILNARPPAAPVVRELVLTVFANILRSRADSLSSGWSTLLAVHSAAAGDTDEALVSTAFAAMHVVMQAHITAITRHGALEDLIKTLVAFAANPSAPELVALRAIDHLASLGSLLARGEVPLNPAETEAPLTPPSPGSKPGSYDHDVWYCLAGDEHADVRDIHLTGGESVSAGGAAAGDTVDGARAAKGVAAAASAADVGADSTVVMESDQASHAKFIRVFGDGEAHLQAWWPLLTGLAALVGGVRAEVRNRSLNVLFALLRRFGPGFQARLWALVYQGVLLPLFDDVTHAPEETSSGPHMSEGSWLKTTCMAALSSLVRLQVKFFGRLQPLLPSLLALLQRTIAQDIEGLARIGVACFQLLLAEAHERFDADVWEQVTLSMSNMFQACTPHDLLSSRLALCGSEAPSAADAAPPTEPEAPLSPNPAEASPGKSPTPAVFAGASQSVAPTLTREQGRGKGELDPSLARILAQRLLGRTIRTTMGEGSVLGIRDSGAAAIQLPWGLMFAPSLAAVLVYPSPEMVLESQATPDGEALSHELPTQLPFRSTTVVTQCVVQLELVSSVGILVEHALPHLSSDQLMRLVEALSASSSFARQFNMDRTLRRALWKAGFMRFARSNKLPSLMRQETSAFLQLAKLLFSLMRECAEDEEKMQLARTQLAKMVSSVATRYAGLNGAQLDAVTSGRKHQDKELARELSSYAPLVLDVLSGVSSSDDETLTSWLAWLYPALVRLAASADRPVQETVQTLLLSKLPALMGLQLA